MKLPMFALFCALSAQAQFAVTIAPVRITGQKAVVALAISNNLARSVESARAICILMDDQGKMVGQSSKWVIGGVKDRPALQPKSGTTFTFVITSPQPWTTTNLTPRISFNRLVMTGGQVEDVNKVVSVTLPP